MKSSLIYSYQVEYDDGCRTFAESIEQMELAEQHGFDAALISEHHFVENGYFPAPMVTLGAVALRTKTLRLGPGVLLLPLYDPLHVAEHATILDVISGGRFIMGLGQGYRKEEFAAFHVPLNDRPGRMREGVEALRAFWTQPVANYEGQHYQYKDVTLRPPPKQKPHPPIWMAAKKKKAVELAAQLGDAWFADPITPLSVLKARMQDYRAMLKQQGKPDTGFDFPFMREAHCAETDEQAWEEVKAGVLYIYQEYLDWGHMQDEDGNPVAPGTPGALEMLRKRFVIGSPETCIRECERYRKELGVTNLIMRMKFPGLSQDRVLKSIKLWGEKVMPHIQ